MPFETVALVPALCFCLSSIFTRMGLDGSTPHTASFVVLQTQFAAFTLALVMVDFSRLSLSWYWVAFFAAGLSSPALSLLFMFRSIHRIGVAPTSSLSNTHAIFGALWAFLLLGERPSAGVWAGVVFVAGGVYVMTGGGGSLARGRNLLLPLLSAACFGMAHVLRKVGFGGVDSVVFGGFLQGMSASVFGPLLLKAATQWQPYVFNRDSVKYFLMAGLAMAFAQLSLLYALRWGEVSRVSPIVSTVPLFTLVLAPLILGGRERLTWRIVAGVCLIVAGVILVTTLR